MPNTYIRRPEDRKPKERNSSVRVPVPRWIDPFPWIQGSSIEKMVMAELVRRGIYFEHTPQKNSLGGFVDPTWEPDFLLPQYHIWIEIQGAYFHTLPGAVERDSLRFAMIEATGWKPIFWWEDDIRTRLLDIMDAVPELYRPSKKLNTKASWKRTDQLPFFEGGLAGLVWDPKDSRYETKGGDLPGTGLDHLAGLRKALSLRARPPQRLKAKRRTRRRPK
jgi:G:T-mismatch repair DNA endonuclease (very short patch repair protein)